MARAVGIDLGTTNSVVAILEGGEPTVIANAEGSRTTPSVVAFAKNAEVLVGEVAKRQAVTNVDRTVRSVKRQMGTDWTINIDGKKFTPQQISAFVLQKLKRDAEAYLGEKITDAVITVPAYFNDAQRQATTEAGRIAGLNVLRIINEPTAAALAYHLEKEGEATILVFDLGGGTFDVSLLEVGEGVVEVKATNGDNHLGGDDWDQRIVDWLVKDFKNGYGIDLSKDKMALQRLREAAEKAKIELSQSMESQINLPYISHSADGPLHLDAKLTRAEFQRLTADLLDRCKGPFQQVIEDASIKIEDVDNVVLVGGSTRMPAVVDLVKSLTGGKEPNKGVNPDEVVAVGACLHAGKINPVPPDEEPTRASVVRVTSRPFRPLTPSGRTADLIPWSAATDSVRARDRVFISYCHADSKWLTRLQMHLMPYVRNELVAVWDDTQMPAGAKWSESIEHGLVSAKVAVLLVTPAFLASKFINDNELPPLLEAASSEGLSILWVPVKFSSVHISPIATYQAAHSPDKPLASLDKAARDRALVKICELIRQEYQR